MCSHIMHLMHIFFMTTLVNSQEFLSVPSVTFTSLPHWQHLFVLISRLALFTWEPKAGQLSQMMYWSNLTINVCPLRVSFISKPHGFFFPITKLATKILPIRMLCNPTTFGWVFLQESHFLQNDCLRNCWNLMNLSSRKKLSLNNT